MAEPKAPMTEAEIRGAIEDMARGEDSAGKRWALKLLRSEQGEESALPQPLTDMEVTQRLARIMRGAGEQLSRAAFVIAHGGYTKRGKAADALKTPEANPLDIDRATLPKTLKQFNRKYPHLKVAGFPVGYPVGKPPGVQVQWIEDRSMMVEMEFRRAKAAEALKGIEVLPISDTHKDVDDGNTPQATA